MMVKSEGSCFQRRNVERALLESHRESGLWRECLWPLKEGAFRIFEGLPWPDITMEEWRRSNIEHLDLGRYLFWEGEVESGEVEGVRDCAGRWVFSGEGEVGGYLSSDLEGSGVVFGSLWGGYSRARDIILGHLGRIVSAEEGKFLAMHYAFLRQGLVLYVPRGVSVERPFVVEFRQGEGCWGVFPHVLVVLEEGARARLHCHLRGGGGEVMLNGIGEVYVGSGARLDLAQVQGLGGEDICFFFTRACVERDGFLRTLGASFGGCWSKTVLEVELRGSGAEARMGGVSFTDGHQHLDQRTLQRHRAPYTVSDLVYRGALLGRSYTVYQGKIVVEKGAQRVDAYQSNKNLILDGRSRVDSIPSLEILANDVKCSHGATAGKVREEELFYLMSRGLSRQEARALILMGFFEGVLGDWPELLEDLQGEVRRKLGLVDRKEVE